MGKFAHVKQSRLTQNSTADLTLYMIDMGDGESPTLTLTPATEINKPYFNAVLKRSGKFARRVQTGKLNINTIRENRDEDRNLYPKFIVKGWSGVIDSDGTTVPFTVADCGDFLGAVDDWVFDEIRAFAGNPENFLQESDDLADVDAGETGKN